MQPNQKIECCVLACATALLTASVWAQEPLGTTSDPLKVAPAKAAPGTCKSGYVWREARPGDKVCVTPQMRENVARQNRDARRLWVQGAYGPHTCVNGYVWREAFKGDDVCVRPEVREQVRQDNAMAARRRAG